jgi:hypothetical protein
MYNIHSRYQEQTRVRQALVLLIPVLSRRYFPKNGGISNTFVHLWCEPQVDGFNQQGYFVINFKTIDGFLKFEISKRLT